MGGLSRKSNERPRELRRRVLIDARMRSGARWSDARILNISSRGLMIQSGSAGGEGSVVQLYRGDHVIVARVVWRSGNRAGLQSEDRVPVEEIMSAGQSTALQLVAPGGAPIERRKHPRMAEHARTRGRMFEFIGVGVIALCLALGAARLVEDAFISPVARVAAALGG